MNTHKLFPSIVAILLAVTAVSLTGCTSVGVITYPTPGKMTGGSVNSEHINLTDHNLTNHGGEQVITNGITFTQGGLRITVKAYSFGNHPILGGPFVLPVFPVFWLEWFAGPFGDKSLQVSVDFDGPGYEFDPAQFVIVQGEQELKPTKIQGIAPNFLLEYATDARAFSLRLHGVRNAAGPVELPDIVFSRGTFWVWDMAP
jgi:uncharacterized protein YceK